ncbi:MAG: tetratricopeptide repeat protein [Verrucomicrobiota bacterium]
MPIVQFCHQAIFALIVFVLGYSVLAYGTSQEWTQGPIVIAVLLAAIFWVIRLALANDATIVFSPLGLPLLVAGSYLIMRYALADVESVGRSSLLMPITAGIFFFVVLNDIRHRWQITALVWIMTGLGALLAVYASFQAAQGGHWILAVPQFEQYWGRGSGTFFRPADLAVFLQIAFAIAAANCILSHRPNTQKLGFAIACIAISFGLLLTKSTGHWVGWGIICAVLVFFAVRKRTWRIRWIIVGLSVLVVVGATIFMATHKQDAASADEGPSLQTELDDLVKSQTAPATTTTPILSQRLLLKAAWSMSQRNIWIGSGGGMFPQLLPRWRTGQGSIEHCPNQYLDVFAAYGLAGIGVMLWIGISLVLALTRIIRMRDTQYADHRLSNRYAFVVPVLAIVIAVIADALVDLRLHTGGLLFPLTAVIAVALTCGVHRRMEESDHQRLKPGHHVTIRLFGASRHAVVAGLVGLVLLIGYWSTATYPSALFLRHGHQALERLDWRGAEQAFQRAWWFDKRNYQVAAALGDLNAARATWNPQQRATLSHDAFQWYNRALTLNRYATDLRIKIGRLHDALNNRDEAMAAYQAALDADPRNASYRVALGRHYQRRGDAAEAQHQFRLARELGATETLPATEATD